MKINPSQNPAPKSHKIIIFIIIAVVVAYFFFMAFSFFAPFWLADKAEKKSDEAFQKVMKMIEPAAEREYQFHEPSPHALSRKIDCKNLSMFQNDLPIVKPLCLNLYKTTPDAINKALSESKNEYDRVVLYGEKLIWDAPVIESLDSGLDYGQAIIDSARFNDQVTIPKMMELYGFKDLSFVNKLTPDKVFPFPALYFRLSNNEEVQKACRKGEYKEAEIAGCALGMWSTIIPSHVLGENLSLANQKVWRISEEKNPPYLAYDYKWPKNCLTDETMLHETAHLFLNAFRVNNIADALVAPKFFNEHQADTIKIMATNHVCGDGSVANFRDNLGKEMGLADFNSIFPPAKMGSAWPKPGETCKLSLLNEWNRFLAKGEFKTQFMAFSDALREWMKNGKTISNDKGFANFLVNLHHDLETKNNLTYRNCYL